MNAPETHPWIRQAAAAIHEGFVNYNNNFRRITQRARTRFEQRDWAGARNDLAERIELYEKSVSRTLATLRKLFPAQGDLLPEWPAIRAMYWSRLDDIPDGEFAKTFFNSVHRDILRDLNLDPTQVSDTADVVAAEAPLRYPARQHNYLNWSSVRGIVRRLLDDFAFRTPYLDIEADVDFICAEIERVVGGDGPPDEVLRRVEVMHDVFYQSSRAFVVGKMFWAKRNAPFVLAFENTPAGIRVEAVLTSSDDVSVLFGFTRSYFMVDVEPVEGAVYFIKAMMPRKPLDELYTILGRARQGKTERYRSFFHHLKACDDQFIHAAGDRGLVMLVFTLPSYDLVFKVIRDSFGFPKNISHEEVKKKYKFVFNHDRAGRLIDTQEFRNIEFPLAKFAPELLEELLTSTSQAVRIEGDLLVIDHLYSERRVTPLNIYLQQYPYEEARAAILDYGQAIKDLAMTNIFAGDLLLKNFGVSRHGRVIFYDYDELCLVTECQFRDVPEADSLEDEMSAENWFYVGPRDIFPEEFIRFLPMEDRLKKAFLEQHGDMLTAAWWRDIKELHAENRAPEVAPYYRLGTRRGGH
ncbi:MAG: bifunctional isocitrate dehydrogenase kinase/phosphatase [Gammaproteobacteria bacterium]|nr:bifunctional isocitrate dehydrogenase kinase/phosphatase [Gammaproteobacteria bacterium]